MKTKALHDTRHNHKDMTVYSVVTLYMTLSVFLPPLCLTKSNKLKHLFKGI